MFNPDLELFDAHPDWGLLLAAYQQKFSGGTIEWLPRITDVAGIAPELLSAIHGKLIALGMLKFELKSPTDGLLYQITTLGRQALTPPGQRLAAPEWLQESDSTAAA
jgi:hypothetical protein